MATKTISIDIEAYERLRRARRSPKESFSMVSKPAEWPTPPRTAGAVLRALGEVPTLGPEVLDGLEAAQAADAPPEDPWQDG